MQHAVDNWVAHVEIGGCHVDFSAQNLGAIFELAIAHIVEKLQVFLDTAVTEGTFHTGLCQRTTSLADFLRGFVGDVRQTRVDEFYSAVEHNIKVVACKQQFVPLETKPLDIRFDTANVLLVFLAGVCVVKTQVALATVLLGKTKVDAQTLGVAYVQVAVWLRWETCINGVNFATGKVAIDYFFNKIS